MMRLCRFLLVCSLCVTQMAGADEGAAPRQFVVGFSQDNMSNDWRAAQVREMQRALEAYPDIRFVYRDARGQAARQAWNLEQLAEEGVDVLVTSPRDVRGMTPVISALHRQGKSVVLLTRRILTDDYTSFIGTDDREIARQAARFMAERMGGKGRVVMLRGVPTASTAIQREKGFLEELQRYPGIEVVASPVANYLRNEAIRVMEPLLARELRFDAIFAQNDGMASGARIALKKAGIDPKSIVIVGIDYIPEAREAIRNGEQAASFTYPTSGREGAETVVRILRGEAVPREQTVPFTMVTRDNVERVPTIFE